LNLTATALDITWLQPYPLLQLNLTASVGSTSEPHIIPTGGLDLVASAANVVGTFDYSNVYGVNATALVNQTSQINPVTSGISITASVGSTSYTEQLLMLNANVTATLNAVVPSDSSNAISVLSTASANATTFIDSPLQSQAVANSVVNALTPTVSNFGVPPAVTSASAASAVQQVFNNASSISVTVSVNVTNTSVSPSASLRQQW
jgi:hypothetical protein